MTGNVLSAKALSRLQRARGRLEAAQASVTQAQSLLQAYAGQYEELLRSLCDEADVEMPREGTPANINVDWISGAVTWQPLVNPQLNGHEQGMGGI